MQRSKGRRGGGARRHRRALWSGLAAVTGGRQLAGQAAGGAGRTGAACLSIRSDLACTRKVTDIGRAPRGRQHAMTP